MSDDGREAYRVFSRGEAALPIFLRDWWLDAVCGVEAWGAVLHMRGTEVHGALPYRLSRRFGLTLLDQPPLTQFLGPWIRDTGGKLANEYSRQKEIMTSLIESLPRHHYYEQNWSPSVDNWLPFYWRGFGQTTRYTYVINTLEDEAALWAELRESTRREIRRAEGREGVTVRSDAAIDQFLVLQKQTFDRQSLRGRPSESLVRRIDEVCASRSCRKIFIAEDAQGRAHAAVYVIWDADKAYYLMGGGDPALRSSGATSLCMWRAMCFAATVTKRFDFEGSMIEPIERFFRSFGAERKPYFRVSRAQPRLLATALAARSAWARG